MSIGVAPVLMIFILPSIAMLAIIFARRNSIDETTETKLVRALKA
jgi:hypothetical protein